MAFGIHSIQGMEARGLWIRLALGTWHWFVKRYLYVLEGIRTDVSPAAGAGKTYLRYDTLVGLKCSHLNSICFFPVQ
jgi:hypothetical protein